MVLTPRCAMNDTVRAVTVGLLAAQRARARLDVMRRRQLAHVVADPHDPYRPSPPYDTLWADPGKREERDLRDV